MDLKTSAQFKTAYMSVLIVEGKVHDIRGGRGTGKTDKTYQAGAGKRGSTIISKELVEIGTVCDVTISRAGKIKKKFFRVTTKIIKKDSAE